MIKVSIIIPVYNVEEYLEECLKSAINQSLKAIEIICIDDGSADSSAEIIKKFAQNDDRIILIQKENGGQASARNIGMDIAKGEYIYFLDSDDYITNNAMEVLYDIAKKELLDDLYFDAESFFETEELEQKHSNYIGYYVRHNSYNEIISGLEMLKRMDENKEFRVSPCLQFLRKEFLNENNIRFSEGFIHEDDLFALEISLVAKRTRHINEILYMRRVRDSSTMTGSDYYKHAYGYFNCIIRLVDKLDKVTLDREYRNVIMKRLYGLQSGASLRTMRISNVELDEYLETISTQEEMLYRLLLKRCADDTKKFNSIKAENKKLKKQLSDVKKSWSYRIGKVITFIPGRIKVLVKTIKCCGWKYVFSTMYRKINKNKVCISIVMPVYNTEKYLEECLTSLQKQSLYNIEVICVNDGSTDGSLEIIQRFVNKDKRFKVINKENTGAGDSRNIGMKCAKGEYLLFLDADDVFNKELCYKAYRRAKVDNADICFMGAERLNMRTGKKEYMSWVLRSSLLPEKTPFQKEEIRDQYFQIVSGCPWSKLFRKEFIMKYQIEFQNLKNSNDVFFVRTAMAMANQLTYVDEKLITYRFAEGDNTQSNKHKNPLEFYKAYKALKEKLIEEKLYESLEKSFVNMVFDDFMFNYRTTATEEAKKIIIDKLKNEAIDFFGFNKYPQDFYENKINVKEYKELLKEQADV